MYECILMHFYGIWQKKLSHLQQMVYELSREKVYTELAG